MLPSGESGQGGTMRGGDIARPPLSDGRSASTYSFVPIQRALPGKVQLAIAFLLGVTAAALAIQVFAYSRWGCRPSELDIAAIQDQRVDLNRSDTAQLLQLPGVGEKMAARIRSSRLEEGDFRGVEDLTRVYGIGQLTLDRLRPYISAQGKESTGDPPATPVKSALKRPANRKQPPPQSINPNVASALELQGLPGIGPKLAERIIDARSKAPFTSVDDLRRISGFGPKIIERIRPFLTFERSSTNIVTAISHSVSTEIH